MGGVIAFEVVSASATSQSPALCAVQLPVCGRRYVPLNNFCVCTSYVSCVCKTGA